MDFLTHALSGLAVGLAFAPKNMRRPSVLIGVIAACVPDIDLFFHQSHQPLSRLIIHRGFTHSLLFIPIFSATIIVIAMLLKPNWRTYWRQLLFIALIANALHGLLDASTPYGTQLAWPFLNERFHWDLTALWNPIFFCLLLIGIITSYKTKQRTPALYALLISFLYFCFCYFQHQQMIKLQHHLITERHHKITQARVIPVLFHLFQWNSVYHSQGNIYLDSFIISLNSPEKIIPHGIIPELSSATLPPQIRKNDNALQALNIFTWFTQNEVAIIKLNPLTVIDARDIYYSSIPESLIGIVFTPQQKSVNISLHYSVALHNITINNHM